MAMTGTYIVLTIEKKPPSKKQHKKPMTRCLVERPQLNQGSGGCASSDTRASPGGSKFLKEVVVGAEGSTEEKEEVAASGESSWLEESEENHPNQLFRVGDPAISIGDQPCPSISNKYKL